MPFPPGLNPTLEAVAQGRFDPDAAVAEAWARARALEPRLHAFAFLPERPPRAGSGPLAGVTVGVKDLIDTADMPTGYGSAIDPTFRPAKDAAIVAQLRALGATILGKTVTTEFAWRHPGPTTNPWNEAHTPGGSSSGSAAAVASGSVQLALGTQTLGSVIRPAAFCGVVGYKPSFGLLPREGVHPLSSSLDHVGLFARSVEDIATAMALLVPALARPTVVAGLPGLRLGVMALPTEVVSADQRTAFENAGARLKSAGALLQPWALPRSLADIQAIANTLMEVEASRHFAPIRARAADRMSAAFLGMLARGEAISDDAYAAACAAQRALRGEVAAASADLDVILTIPAPGEAPAGLTWTGDASFCAPWSVTGLPSVTIPAGLGATGLPLGLQLVGRSGGDAALLSIAMACAAALPPAPRPDLP